MTGAVTPSQLRQDIYRLLDDVLESGRPLEIVRKGRTLRLVPDQVQPRIAAIRVDPSALVGDPDDIVELDWSSGWDPELATDP